MSFVCLFGCFSSVLILRYVKMDAWKKMGSAVWRVAASLVYAVYHEIIHFHMFYHSLQLVLTVIKQPGLLNGCCLNHSQAICSTYLYQRFENSWQFELN